MPVAPGPGVKPVPVLIELRVPQVEFGRREPKLEATA
jgi:hypothetical protein